MDKISVIIPVYNVEPYMRKCLDSVINQTYKNLEILLIDDGSTDNSGNICDEYAGNDNRIRVFHKENGGLSSALNVGIENFTGNYIGFVDSDDFIEHDMYEILCNAAKTEYAPISVVNYFKDTGAESVPMVNRAKIPIGVINTDNMLLFALKRDYYMGFCSYVWNKLYSSEIIKTGKINFDNNIKYGMDVVFYYTLIMSGKCTGVYTDKPLYHYLQRNTAISKTTEVDLRTHILTAYKKTEELLNNNGYSSISFWARGFYCYHAGIIAEIAAANGDIKTLKAMQTEIKDHLDDYIKTNEKFPYKCERMRRLLDLEVIKQ